MRRDGVDTLGSNEARLGEFDLARLQLGGDHAEDSKWLRSIDNLFARDLWERSGGRVPPHPDLTEQ